MSAQIEIVTPHREDGDEHYWSNSGRTGENWGEAIFCCVDPDSCPAEALIPEALLVELVEGVSS